MDIRDIARLSGYGVGTVSRVLNGHPNVSNRARKKVLAVVEEQGYEPNGNARYLKAQARTPIAIFVKGSRNMLFFELLEEIEFRLAASGEDAQVNYLDEDEKTWGGGHVGFQGCAVDRIVAAVWSENAFDVAGE